MSKFKNSINVCLIAVMLVLTGCDSTEKDEAERERLERQAQFERMQAKKRKLWSAYKRRGESALSTGRDRAAAITDIKEYIQKTEDPDYVAKARGLLEQLIEAEENAERVRLQQINEVLVTLNAKAEPLQKLGNFLDAKALYDNYSGPFASVTAEKRREKSIALDVLIADAEREAEAAFKKHCEERENHIYAICDDMINRKSYDSLKSFLKSENVDDFPALKEVTTDFIKVKSAIIAKYTEKKGEVLSLTIKGKEQKVGLVSCDSKYLTCTMKIGSQKIRTKVPLKDISLEDRIDGLELNEEALALYAAVMYRSAGDEDSAVQAALKTKLVNAGLFKALGVDPDEILLDEVLVTEKTRRPKKTKFVSGRKPKLTLGDLSKSPLASYLIGVQQPHAVSEENNVNPQMYDGVPTQLWVADQLVNTMNSDILKLAMTTRHLERERQNTDNCEYLEQFAQHSLYKKILDLDYRIMYLWSHGSIKFKYYNESKEDEVYQEFYDFTRYLLKEYNDSGKTFMLGNWEGDWILGAKTVGEGGDCSEDNIRRMISWMNAKGRAIEDAKKKTKHSNVNVNFYVEVNHVNCAREYGVKRMINAVVPHLKYLDYVSISSYEIQGILKWPKPRSADSLKDHAFTNLDYVEKQLPPRNIAGKRVIIGEIGYTIAAIKKQYRVDEDDAEIIQARLALENAQVNLEWGCDMWLWWAYHNNERDDNGEFEGFGIHDQSTMKKRRLYYELNDYFSWAQEFTQDMVKKRRRNPSQEEMRKATISWLKKRIRRLS